MANLDKATINMVPPTAIVEKIGRRLGTNANMEKLKEASQSLAKFLDELLGDGPR